MNKALKDNANYASNLLKSNAAVKNNIQICRVNTGAYIYTAYILVCNGRYEYHVKKENKVTMVNRYSQVLADTIVRVSAYGIEYNNQDGKIHIPFSVSKKLIQFHNLLGVDIS